MKFPTRPERIVRACCFGTYNYRERAYRYLLGPHASTAKLYSSNIQDRTVKLSLNRTNRMAFYFVMGGSGSLGLFQHRASAAVRKTKVKFTRGFTTKRVSKYVSLCRHGHSATSKSCAWIDRHLYRLNFVCNAPILHLKPLEYRIISRNDPHPYYIDSVTQGYPKVAG